MEAISERCRHSEAPEVMNGDWAAARSSSFDVLTSVRRCMGNGEAVILCISWYTDGVKRALNERSPTN